MPGAGFDGGYAGRPVQKGVEPAPPRNFKKGLRLKLRSMRQRAQQKLKSDDLFGGVDDRLHVTAKLFIGDDVDESMIGNAGF